MAIQTNFIDELFPSIYIELHNASEEQLPLAVRDIINLCGGMPAPDITNARVIITPTYGSALSVKINTDQYEVARNMDFEIGRIDNNYMQSESGRELWKNTGFTRIGNFYLAKGHPCPDYLRMHLQRKKIDFTLVE